MMGRVSLLALLMSLGSLATALFLVAPFIVVLPNGFSSAAYLQFPAPGPSLQWFRHFFADPTWTRALSTSLRVGIGAAALATAAGTAAALALDDWTFRGKAALTFMLISPLVVPAVIVGIAAYTFFVGMHWYGSLGGLIATHAILGLPYVLLSVLAALSRLDRRIRLAALSLGAGPPRVFREITLPLVLPSILSGAVLAFVISFDDVVVATFLANVRTTTLPMRMFQAVESELDPTIAAVSTLLIGFAILVLLALSTMRMLEQRQRTPSSHPEEVT
ncbi:MAG TPA: ABC transporter permease [Gaiellales bacterium]|nr:ABC transporter permease [Gaiellales bacterium]